MCCSRWRSFKLKISFEWGIQGSILGPLLVLIYINDLDNNITGNVQKFAEDTKVFRKVNTDGDIQHLKNDLDKLVKWSDKWQMLLHFVNAYI